MEIVTMTPAARSELERACSKQSNWNDFGYWIGKGNAPNCFQREHYKSTISRVIFFPSDESASRWNSAWEREIRHGGHCGTVGLTVAVTLISSAGVGAVVGTIAAIFKDELQVKLFYPKVEREWCCSICFNHEYR